MAQRFVRLRFVFRTCWLVLCAALLLGPQVVLQLAAWSFMLVSYTQESTLQEAVTDTFSGQRPCELCTIINSVEEAQENQTRSTRASDDFRLLIPRLEAVTVSPPPDQTFDHPGHFAQPAGILDLTPAPPPKFLV